MAASCSHWWHVPIYFFMSVALAVVVITSFPSTQRNDYAFPNQTIPHELSLRAFRTLKQHGFNVIATLFQISPELLLLSPQSTIFAIQDSAISNISVPPRVMKQLLQYHTVVSKLSMQDLLGKSSNTCLATSIPEKNVAITKIDPKDRSIDINNVSLSHPDLFLEGPLSIHGVLVPFTSLNPQEIDDLDFIHSPLCAPETPPNNRPEWIRIIRKLGSNGFSSFAIGLHSVLDGIIRDYPELNSATILAPPELGFVASPSPVLERIVRYHILPKRYSHEELASLPDKASVKTLVPKRYLEITSSGNATRVLAINGVDIATPEVLSAKMFVVHGISHALEFPELANAS
ncbi:hypothetical protein Nepgr_012890 [Nepenthes gracilis]|uniref:FAS1 domain-containing protein n=1 Tax=Nepenthes gracilis TaxID=150966 RepID=A0AAD3SI22_NEPGR|nr:hypothetical protein Nepgr_012890 [Nepenthes gracilis]